jgi:hypothetical protein
MMWSIASATIAVLRGTYGTDQTHFNGTNTHATDVSGGFRSVAFFFSESLCKGHNIGQAQSI